MTKTIKLFIPGRRSVGEDFRSDEHAYDRAS